MSDAEDEPRAAGVYLLAALVEGPAAAQALSAHAPAIALSPLAAFEALIVAHLGSALTSIDRGVNGRKPAHHIDIVTNITTNYHPPTTTTTTKTSTTN